MTYDSIYNNFKQKQFRSYLRKNQSDAEQRLWYFLRGKRFCGLKFFRQSGVGKYVLDFYCPIKRLAIELDGGQHNQDKVREYDAVRTEFLGNQNIIVLRFWDNEVFSNIEGVMDIIIKALNSP